MKKNTISFLRGGVLSRTCQLCSRSLLKGGVDGKYWSNNLFGHSGLQDPFPLARTWTPFARRVFSTALVHSIILYHCRCSRTCPHVCCNSLQLAISHPKEAANGNISIWIAEYLSNPEHQMSRWFLLPSHHVPFLDPNEHPISIVVPWYQASGEQRVAQFCCFQFEDGIVLAATSLIIAHSLGLGLQSIQIYSWATSGNCWAPANWYGPKAMIVVQWWLMVVRDGSRPSGSCLILCCFSGDNSTTMSVLTHRYPGVTSGTASVQGISASCEAFASWKYIHNDGRCRYG